MKNEIIIGGLTAIVTGAFISMQALLSGRAGQIIGPINTGFWTNFLGGSIAGLLILSIGAFRGFETVKITAAALPIVAIAGMLGIMIIMGVSFSTARAGVAAGLSAIMFGQLVFGTLADTFGWGGSQPIPLDARRIVGLAVMAVAIFLLMKRN